MPYLTLRNVGIGVAGLMLSMANGLSVAGEVGVVSHIKVLSDKVEDVSSLEAWKASFIKPG